MIKYRQNNKFLKMVCLTSKETIALWCDSDCLESFIDSLPQLNRQEWVQLATEEYNSIARAFGAFKTVSSLMGESANGDY
jgi:hypothetical protein